MDDLRSILVKFLKQTLQERLIDPPAREIDIPVRVGYVPERLSSSMPDEIRHILNDEQARSQKGDVVRYDREDAVMAVPAVMVAISDLAEPLTWRPCNEKLDLAQSSTIIPHDSAASLGQEIGPNCGLAWKVVIVGRNRFFP